MQSGTDEQEEDSSGRLDLNELCGLAENEDIKMYLDFLTRIENASLEDNRMTMAPDDLECLCHPPQEKVDLDDPDLWLALDLSLLLATHPKKLIIPFAKPFSVATLQKC